MTALNEKTDIELSLPSENNRIVLIPRDPHRLYAFWELSEGSKNSFIKEFGLKTWEKSVPVLRVNNVTTNRRTYIRIDEFSGSWFINVHNPGSIYIADLGRLVSGQFFICLAESNYAVTPADNISNNTMACFINYKDFNKNMQSKGGRENSKIHSFIFENVRISDTYSLGLFDEVKDAVSGISSGELSSLSSVKSAENT